MSGRVLVTGASGRAGGVMVRRLQDAGVPVRAAIHYPDHDAESRATAVDYVEVDFDRPETLDTAFSGVDKAVLITPEETDDDTHDGASRARRRACRRGLPGARVVHPRRVRRRRPVARLASRGRGDRRRVADPLGDLAAQLVHAELRHHVPAEHLHPGTFFTPMGQGRISYVDGRDVADAAVEILLAGGHEDAIYSLTGPDSLAHDEIADILTAETGQTIRYVDVGEDDACVALRRRGASAELVHALCELWLDMRRGAFAPTTDDVERLVARSPRSFVDFVREHRDEIRVSPTARS